MCFGVNSHRVRTLGYGLQPRGAYLADQSAPSVAHSPGVLRVQVVEGERLRSGAARSTMRVSALPCEKAYRSRTGVPGFADDQHLALASGLCDLRDSSRDKPSRRPRSPKCAGLCRLLTEPRFEPV